MPAGCRPGQKKIGDIGAANEQKKCNCGQEDMESGPNVRTHLVFQENEGQMNLIVPVGGTDAMVNDRYVLRCTHEGDVRL